MELVVILILALLTPQGAFASTVGFSADVSLDSSLMVSGQMDNDTQWVWIRIEKAALSNELIRADSVAATTTAAPLAEDVFPVLVQHHFQQKIYLRSGAGKYQITVRESKAAAQYGSSYYDVSTQTVTNQDARNLSFLLPSEKVQSDDPTIIALAAQITDGIEDELSASKAIHDWVATHIAYDVLDYFAGIQKDFSALETLQTRIAYCNGYAHLNAALHRAAGIPAKIIFGQARSGGEAVNHAWNEVFVGGVWIIEDATWDAGGIAFGTQDFHFQLSEKYFNPQLIDFQKDHTFIEVLTGE